MMYELAVGMIISRSGAVGEERREILVGFHHVVVHILRSAYSLPILVPSASALLVRAWSVVTTTTTTTSDL